MLYELMYIIPTSVTDDDVGKVEGEVKAVLDKVGASLSETKRLGKFRFAYPIKKERHGHYILAHFEAEPSAISTLDRLLRITPNVLRHLILRGDEVAGPYTLTQFVEVNVDTKDDRRGRRKSSEASSDEKGKSTEEIKSGVAALENSDDDKKEKKTDALSDEELDKKLAAALEDDAQTA